MLCNKRCAPTLLWAWSLRVSHDARVAKLAVRGFERVVVFVPFFRVKTASNLRAQQHRRYGSTVQERSNRVPKAPLTSPPNSASSSSIVFWPRFASRPPPVRMSRALAGARPATPCTQTETCPPRHGVRASHLPATRQVTTAPHPPRPRSVVQSLPNFEGA